AERRHRGPRGGAGDAGGRSRLQHRLGHHRRAAVLAGHAGREGTRPVGAARRARGGRPGRRAADRGRRAAPAGGLRPATGGARVDARAAGPGPRPSGPGAPRRGRLERRPRRLPAGLHLDASRRGPLPPLPRGPPRAARLERRRGVHALRLRLRDGPPHALSPVGHGRRDGSPGAGAGRHDHGPGRMTCRSPAAALVLLAVAAGASAQELEPRAYSPNPTGANFVLVVYGHTSGNVMFDPSVPITNVEAAINTGALFYGRTFALFGRAASAAVQLPYVWGTIDGDVFEDRRSVYRSGLADLRMRLTTNILGGPALSAREFAARPPRTTMGASLVVLAPTGQYDPSKLVNVGTNRWAFKPEV